VSGGCREEVVAAGQQLKNIGDFCHAANGSRSKANFAAYVQFPAVGSGISNWWTLAGATAVAAWHRRTAGKSDSEHWLTELTRLFA